MLFNKMISRDFWLKILHHNTVILRSHKTRDKKNRKITKAEFWNLESRWIWGNCLKKLEKDEFPALMVEAAR